MGFVRFAAVRSAVFAFNFVVSAAVVILVAYQASIFLTNGYDKAWIIFGLVVSSLSLVCSTLMWLSYGFKTHITIIVILWVLWLALAAWTTDRIGYLSCESLDGTTRPTSPGRSEYDNVSWCRQTKAVEGLSWFNFALMLIAIISWIRLQEEEERYPGFRDDDSTSDRAPYRAAEVAAHEDGLRRRGFGVPTTYYSAQAPVYQQPGQPIVVQGGQIVGAPVYQ